MRKITGPRALILVGAVLMATGSLAACSSESESKAEPAATADDVTGTRWNGTGFGGEHCAVLFDVGGRLAGQCSKGGFDYGGTGSWQQNGSSISFDIPVDTVVVDHEGTISGETMSGTYSGSDGSSGTWEFTPAG